MSAYTIKIEYNEEIRKLTGIKNFDDFCASVCKKLQLDIAKLEFSYLDEDNEDISFTSADEFEHIIKSYAKIPKIVVKLVEDDEDSVDIASSFLNIGMTVSVCERPVPQANAQANRKSIDESNDEIEHEIIEDSKEEAKEEVKEELSQNSVEEQEIQYEVLPEPEGQYEESKVDRSQEMDILEVDEKGTSTNHDGVLTNSNSIQTQSVEIVNAATDVDYLILNHDEKLGTEALRTEDKSNQKEVNLVDWASDPVEVEKASQEVNTDIIEAEEIEKEQQKIYSQDELDSKLSEIVKHLMKEMTPMMIEECHKYIQKSASESSQKANSELKMFHEEVHNSKSWISHLNEEPIHSFCGCWNKNALFEVIFRCKQCKKVVDRLENDNQSKQNSSS